MTRKNTTSLAVPQRAGTVQVRGQNYFVPSGHFKEGSSEVSIVYISKGEGRDWRGRPSLDNFLDYIQGNGDQVRIEENIPLWTGSIYDLFRPGNGTWYPPLPFNHKRPMTLWALWNLLVRQGHGREGWLLTNGYGNLFHLLGDNDSILELIIAWSSFFEGWMIHLKPENEVRDIVVSRQFQ